METEYRAVEIRFDEDQDSNGPGLLTGVLMAYGSRARDRAEVFEDGSLHWEEAGIVLREMHNRQAPICRFVPELRDSEVRVRIPLPDSQRGRDAALGIRNGTYRGLSVEFRSERENQKDGTRRISKAHLVGCGLVDDPSYLSCNVSVRNRVDDRRPELQTLWL